MKAILFTVLIFLSVDCLAQKAEVKNKKEHEQFMTKAGKAKAKKTNSKTEKRDTIPCIVAISARPKPNDILPNPSVFVSVSTPGFAVLEKLKKGSKKSEKPERKVVELLAGNKLPFDTANYTIRNVIFYTNP